MESVASLVAGKPPHLWSDQDLDRFELELLLLRNQLSHVLTLASYRDKRVLSADGDRGWAARISITTSNGDESEQVIQLDGKKGSQARDYAARLMSALRDMVGDRDHDMAAAVATQLAEMLLERRDNPSKEG